MTNALRLAKQPSLEVFIEMERHAHKLMMEGRKCGVKRR
jgi:hypothetical protein